VAEDDVNEHAQSEETVSVLGWMQASEIGQFYHDTNICSTENGSRTSTSPEDKFGEDLTQVCDPAWLVRNSQKEMDDQSVNCNAVNIDSLNEQQMRFLACLHTQNS
jgi:hypothetical protein